MNGRTAGFFNGLVGVAIFSGSLPATRLAVHDLDPLFLTAARAAIAALLGGGLLVLGREKRPSRTETRPILIVAFGVVIGFPLLTALALRSITSAHAVVYVGLLPLSTAAFAVLRGGERPRPAFWLFSLAGSLAVAIFALGQGQANLAAGDALMLAAIVVCGLGYAEGASLSRRLGGWQTISWALVAALPLSLAAASLLAPPIGVLAATRWPALGALAYVSVFSMLVGFVFWYRGLAQGGVAAVGQLQLLQPFMGLGLSALILGEPVGAAAVATAGAVVLCVAGARRFA